MRPSTISLAAAAAVLVLGALPAAAQVTTKRTPVAACRAQDNPPDGFTRFCEGPGGAAAVLSYFDQRATFAAGKAAAGTPDTPAPATAAGVAQPLDVAAGSDPFGIAVTWASVNGAPCAVGLTVAGKAHVAPLSGGVASPAANLDKALAAACSGGARAKAPKKAAADGAAAPTAPAQKGALAGLYLSLGSDAPGAEITKMDGRGSTFASASGRVTKAGATSACSGFSPNDAKRTKDCASDWMRRLGGRAWTASADCTSRSIRAADGQAYAYAGMGQDYGGPAPTWKLATGGIADRSQHGSSAQVTQQFTTLCPGSFAAEGFADPR